MISSTAVQQVNGRPVAFVAGANSMFEVRNVELGTKSSGWAEVKSGIAEGETVASQGSFFIKSTLLRSQVGGKEYAGDASC